MGTRLPALSESEFTEEIAERSPLPISAVAKKALYVHYEELRRWNPSLSLVGPGTAKEVISRHYGEALQALRLVPAAVLLEPSQEASSEPLAEPPPAPSLIKNPPLEPRGFHLVDIGSGGGFPGFVLAAACPGLDVWLVEARQRKWSFLKAASRKAAVPCQCINSRIQVPLDDSLPDTIHLLTLRALGLPGAVFGALRERLPASGRLLLWQTLPLGDPPRGFTRLRTVPLPGSERRCLTEYGPIESAEGS